MKTQKLLLSVAVALAGLCPSFGASPQNLQDDPAYLPIDKVLDFKIVKPEVNINLPRFLLMDAASEFDGGKDDPLAKAGLNFKDLVKDIKLIRLVVIETKQKEARDHVQEALAKLRQHVEGSWTPIVSVSEKDSVVGIYARGDASGDQMAGLAMLIGERGEAVIGNIVGRVSIGKVLKLASQMNSIPKDLMKKLSAFAEADANKDAGKGPKSEAKGEQKPGGQAEHK